MKLPSRKFLTEYCHSESSEEEDADYYRYTNESFARQRTFKRRAEYRMIEESPLMNQGSKKVKVSNYNGEVLDSTIQETKNFIDRMRKKIEHGGQH